jgi:HEAT repeat protein
MTVEELLAKIKDKDDKVRSAAWLAAGEVGAPAVKPLAAVVCDPSSELEVGRATKHAMWKIVRSAGRPGADAEKNAVVAELLALLAEGQPTPLAREVLWMLSEIGGNESVLPLAKLLVSRELREDARCCLQRIPGDKSLGALRAGLAAAPDDFKSAMADALRARGVDVSDVRSKKLVPTKSTSVKPVGR